MSRYPSKVQIEKKSFLIFLLVVLLFGELDTASSLSQCVAENNNIHAVVWYPDETNLLIATSTGLYRYDLDKKLVSPLNSEDTQYPVDDVSFSPDGSSFAVASPENSSAKLYDFPAFSLTETLETPYDGITKLTFNNSGNLFAGVSVRLDPDTGFPYEYLIRVWNLSTKEIVTDITNVGLSVDSIRFTPDDEHLLIDASFPGYGKSEVRFWNIENDRVDTDITERLVFADLAPDGSLISLVTKDLMDTDTVSVINTAELKSLYETTRTVNVTTTGFDKNARFIAISDTAGEITIYDLLEDELVKTIETNLEGITQVSPASDGQRLIITVNDDAEEEIHFVSMIGSNISITPINLCP